MGHWNQDKVVGGIENPRFLIVGPELSPNISFEDGLSGVSSPTGAASQVFDSTTPFLDYVLRIEDDDPNAQEYAEITIDTGAPIAEKRFIVFAHARNDADVGDQACWCVFQGLSGTHEKEFMLNQEWQRVIVHEVVVPADATGNVLTYRIYPFGKSEGNAGTGAIRIDNFHVRQVLQEYEMPLPDRGKQIEIFRMIKQAEHELADGSIKTYKKGFRYYYEAGYDRLETLYESYRAQLAKTDNEILFFPHKDSSNCYLVKWDSDLERRWAFGTAALGHQAEVRLIGQEILHVIPAEVVDSLTEYTYEGDILYIEGGEAIL